MQPTELEGTTTLVSLSVFKNKIVKPKLENSQAFVVKSTDRVEEEMKNDFIII